MASTAGWLKVRAKVPRHGFIHNFTLAFGGFLLSLFRLLLFSFPPLVQPDNEQHRARFFACDPELACSRGGGGASELWNRAGDIQNIACLELGLRRSQRVQHEEGKTTDPSIFAIQKIWFFNCCY